MLEYSSNVSGQCLAPADGLQDSSVWDLRWVG